ncbi:hypothetical protein FDP25_07685 [Roseovarius sp. A21]|uniref:Uncharacterized protein n=1 Tax=Roseovarius bejariae TaxID=2576383 RepID=A0A844CJ11_9RHOB|nr:hypothetical protein [Roseovarius bejariae]MRU15311.1 hypothetical protein [Roseovarius bejariae]
MAYAHADSLATATILRAFALPTAGVIGFMIVVMVIDMIIAVIVFATVGILGPAKLATAMTAFVTGTAPRPGRVVTVAFIGVLCQARRGKHNGKDPGQDKAAIHSVK